MTEKDYSGTPLWRKLGIKEGSRVATVGAPAHFRSLLGRLPDDVNLGSRLTKNHDVIVAFETRGSSLDKRFPSWARALQPAGGLWVCYPKKSSSIDTDLIFEAVQEIGLDAGLVDNKSCAIDADWSGVRFVYRLKDRPHTS
jgi:hypothetical protein